MLYVTDCEGPVTLNDNAFELSTHFLQEGEALFRRLSRYDDLLADVLRRPGYRSGDTLRIILPFFKAYGLTDEKIRSFSEKNLLFTPGAPEVLANLSQRLPVFIISTSYQPYVVALCKALNFPLERAYFTSLSLDRYTLPKPEEQRLKEIAAEIVSWPEENFFLEEKEGSLLPELTEIIASLDRVFWEELPRLKIGECLQEVRPVGGKEKVAALKEILDKQGADVAEVMYVGDSITDQDALRFVREGGGMSVSFNGNRYALAVAEVACIASRADVLQVLGEAFAHTCAQGVRKLVAAGTSSLEEKLSPRFSKERETFLRVEPVTEKNREELIRLSEGMRKALRGEKIGTLG